MEKLVFGWDLKEPVGYACAVLAGAILVRFVMALLRSLELHYGKEQRAFGDAVVSSFKGIHGHNAKPKDNDYWFPFFIGVLELSAYPILLSTGALTAVGAWIALKTAAMWKTWSEDRPVFNRFLIGNALIVLLAFVIARSGFVVLKLC